MAAAKGEWVRSRGIKDETLQDRWQNGWETGNTGQPVIVFMWAEKEETQGTTVEVAMPCHIIFVGFIGSESLQINTVSIHDVLSLFIYLFIFHRGMW